jgi:trigger factor
VETQVEELADNRVRLTVDVPAEDVEHAVEHAASDLSASVRIPGFRKGKVPMPVLLSRIGRERLYAEAVDSHIAGWFRNAAAAARVHPVAQPEFEFELPQSDREPWQFVATVSVQPRPELADWRELEVPRAEPEVPEELVEGELEALRTTVAELAPVDGRPAQDGDTLVVDLVDASGETRRDYVVELGAGMLVEDVERELVGTSAGETKEIAFSREEGDTTTVTVTVNEIKERVLPPLDDELARTATEFETLGDLRADIEARLLEQLDEEAEAAFRAQAADALAEASKVDPAPALVEARTRELLAGLARSVERRGLTLETYLQLTGGSPEELVERLRSQARQAVARELALEAAADDLGVEVSDEEVEALIRDQSAAAGDDPEETLAQIRAAGAFERLREDLRLRAALDRVASEVKPISAEVAAVREKLWTPEKEKPDTPTKLWTPMSKERA